MRWLILFFVLLVPFSLINTMEEDYDDEETEETQLLGFKEVKKKLESTNCKKKTIFLLVVTAATVAVGGSGSSFAGLKIINDNNSPLTGFPYTFNGTDIFPPNITHKDGCSYAPYDQPMFLPTYVKGECLCSHSNSCQCIVETCENAQEYITGYDLTLSGQIIGLIFELPFIGYGVHRTWKWLKRKA